MKEMLELLNTPIMRPQDGDYVELVDENNPNGDVRFCRKDGTVYMLMPRSVYDAVKNYKKDDNAPID